MSTVLETYTAACRTREQRRNRTAEEAYQAQKKLDDNLEKHLTQNVATFEKIRAELFKSRAQLECERVARLIFVNVAHLKQRPGKNEGPANSPWEAWVAGAVMDCTSVWQGPPNLHYAEELERKSLGQVVGQTRNYALELERKSNLGKYAVGENGEDGAVEA